MHIVTSFKVSELEGNIAGTSFHMYYNKMQKVLPRKLEWHKLENMQNNSETSMGSSYYNHNQSPPNQSINQAINQTITYSRSLLENYTKDSRKQMYRAAERGWQEGELPPGLKLQGASLHPMLQGLGTS